MSLAEKRAPLAAEVIRDRASLVRLSGEWDELLAAADVSSPTMSPLWVGAWCRVFGDLEGRELRAVAFRHGARLVGLAPLASRRVWLRPGVPTRMLELIPSGEPEDDEIASDYLAVLAARGFEQRVADGLAALLLTGGLGRWDELVLPRMSMDSVMVPLLVSALERVGETRFEVEGGSPYIPLPRTWNDYLAKLSGSRRRLVRNSLRDYEEWSGGRSCLHVAGNAEELERGMQVLRDLHQQRWSDAGKPGAFSSPAFSAFHAEVMPALLGRGQLELLWLMASDQPIAAIYNIVWNGAIHFYQSGRRIDLPPKLRPGLVLHAMAIRRSIELGRREYDFLAGGARYKQDLALAERPLCTIQLYRPRALNKARRAYEVAASLARAAAVSRRKP